MAAFLTTAQRDIVQSAVDYIVNTGGICKPVDDIVANILSRNHAIFGFNGDQAFREALRNDPVKALLDALIYLNSHA